MGSGNNEKNTGIGTNSWSNKMKSHEIIGIEGPVEHNIERDLA